MRTAEFVWNGKSWHAGLSKLNRADVYGWSEVQCKDKEGQVCTMATLIDGRHVLPAGSVSMIKHDGQGNPVKTSDLVGVDANSNPVEKHPSVYSGPVQLSKGMLDDYLALAVKAVYVMQTEADCPFQSELEAGELFQLAFNYREDYEADDAFMVSNGTDVFLVTGQIAELEYLAQHQQESPVEDESDEGTEDDMMDFSMF